MGEIEYEPEYKRNDRELLKDAAYERYADTIRLAQERLQLDLDRINDKEVK